MKHEPLPIGCYDATSAANELGITNKQLLKKLRELNWIMNAPTTKRHNLPRRELEIRGFLTTHDRYYRPKKCKDIVRINRVTIITKAGFNELKNIIETENKSMNFIHSSGHAEILNEASRGRHYSVVSDTEKNATQEEHDKCLEQLREWGLAS